MRVELGLRAECKRKGLRCDVAFWRNLLLGIEIATVGVAGCYAQAHLVVGASVPLTRTANGVDGELQILKDERITTVVAKQVWGNGGLDLGAQDYVPSFRSLPALNALLRVVDRSGTVLDQKELDRPLARIGKAQLYRDGKVTYLLTVDYSAGFGSYSGPITFFIEIEGGKLHWLETAGPDGRRELIRVMDSLKTEWRIVSAAAGGKEILEAACRPTDKTFRTGGGFTITYSRYFFDGTDWKLLSRTAPGFTEFDQGFPNRRQFP